MTISPPYSEFEKPQHHLRERAEKRPHDKAVGLVLTVAAHIAVVIAILFGVQVTKPLMAEKTIMADVIPDTVKPPPPEVVIPKLAPPPSVTVPEPEVTIAPPAATPITATPPRSVPPTDNAPVNAPIAQPGTDGRANFLAQLLAQLNRFKQYPREARAGHIEGVTLVHFIMNRQGGVLKAEIAKSSGRPILDREALLLMDRAQPLPALPGDMKGDSFDAIVPIKFSLTE